MPFLDFAALREVVHEASNMVILVYFSGQFWAENDALEDTVWVVWQDLRTSHLLEDSLGHFRAPKMTSGETFWSILGTHGCPFELAEGTPGAQNQEKVSKRT